MGVGGKETQPYQLLELYQEAGYAPYKPECLGVGISVSSRYSASNWLHHMLSDEWDTRVVPTSLRDFRPKLLS